MIGQHDYDLFPDDTSLHFVLNKTNKVDAIRRLPLHRLHNALHRK